MRLVDERHFGEMVGRERDANDARQRAAKSSAEIRRENSGVRIARERRRNEAAAAAKADRSAAFRDVANRGEGGGESERPDGGGRESAEGDEPSESEAATAADIPETPADGSESENGAKTDADAEGFRPASPRADALFGSTGEGEFQEDGAESGARPDAGPDSGGASEETGSGAASIAEPPAPQPDGNRAENGGKTDAGPEVEAATERAYSLAMAERLRRLASGRRLRAAALLLLAIGFAIYGLFYYLDAPADRGATSSVSTAPALDPTPGGGIQQTSPAYRESVAQSNDEGAAEAIADPTASYVPTPEALPQPVEAVADPDSADAEPLPAAPPPDTLWAASSPPAEDFLLEPALDPILAGLPPDAATAVPPANPILPYLEALVDRPFPAMGGRRIPPPASEPPLAAAGGGAGRFPEAIRSAAPESPFRPGDLAHARILHRLDSDYPGPAIAEIVEGEHRGLRLAGSFDPRPAEGGLALEFDLAAFPDGRRAPVEAYGLSPWTGGRLTRSRLESRLLGRVGIPALIALLSGAAASAATGAQSLAVVGDAVWVERGVPGEREIIASGVAAAVDSLGRAMSASAPAGPRVVLEAGAPVVILFGAAAGAADSSTISPSAAAPSSLSPFLPAAALDALPDGGLPSPSQFQETRP